MINSFDVFFYKLINQTLSNSSMDFLMVRFSDKYFWIPFYCVIIWMLSKQFGKKTLWILACIAISVVFSDRLTSGIMKPAFGRVRPCHVLSLNPRLPEGIQCSDTGSMASSHAANHFSIAVFMVLLYGLKRRSNMVFWFLWAFSIAYSRVYCGVHYPSDVIVGSLLGAFIGYLCFTLYSKTKDKVLWK